MPSSPAAVCAWGIAIGAAIGGCALDRSAIAGTDAGLARDGATTPDGGPRCREGGCDDGSPCTTDRCVPATGCAHDPVEGACDDGVLCNGGDRCGGGSCSAHDGIDPCPGASRCEPGVDRCVGCESDVDCPTETTGDWGACEFLGDPCTQEGARSRTITRYACSAGTCEPAASTESEACSRTTDGAPCGTPSIGAWSDCAYADTTCSTEGSRTRSVITRACSGGACVTTNVGETDESACGRTTEGTICGDVVIDSGTCRYASACIETGARSVTTTSRVCGSGSCGPSSTTRDEPCSRDTDGTACGSEACSDWSACTSSVTGCATSGTQSRTCGAPSCVAGACALGATRSESRGCTIDPTGMPCTTSRVCGSCRARGSACPAGMIGTRTCSGPTGACTSAGTCFAISTTEDCNCP